ncbi:MAG: methyltransferase domain-containing protein [Candidatus Methanomethylicaceae archaeon]
MAQVRVFMRLLIELGNLVLQKKRWPDDRMFLQAVYRACLKRNPDADGEEFYISMLWRKSMNRIDVLKSVLSSNEFKQVHGLPIHPLEAVHQARMMLVRRCLPSAQVIVDLGGADQTHREGALLAMGYPYRPQRLIIIDLSLPKHRSWITPNGIHIVHYKGSMTDLSWIESESVDLVWAGESIEHVTQAEAEVVFREVYRILRPGGYFCLDTPNASLTRLQSPNVLIHPEHKKEYYVTELRSLIESQGFQVREAKGICPMPESLRSGIFNYREIVENIRLSDNPQEGYLFYIMAIKPIQ